MQIRNFFWYILNKPLPSSEEITKTLSDYVFKPCSHQQEMSQGWVAPLEDGGLVYDAHGAQLLMLKQEKRLLPASVVNEYLQDKIEHFEAQEGYKPSRAVKQQMKEDITITLLPKAFTKSSRIPILILPKQGWVFVLGAGNKTAEDTTSFLRACLGSLPTSLINTNDSTANTMTRWLIDPVSIPANWQLGEEVELIDTEKAVVKIRNQHLLGDELDVHTSSGKLVSKLAMIWRDQISILLHEDLSIKRIKLLQEDDGDHYDGDDKAAKFAHEFAVSCNWLLPLCQDILEAFGGLDEALASSQSRSFEEKAAQIT